MAEETDGVGETLDDSLRIALTIASQFGERIARLREQLAHQREASATQEARELEARFEAERGAARASLAPIEQPEWWNQATPEDIAGVHETATAWRDFDDVARDAGDTIKHEVRERYGIDIDSPGADPAVVAAALRNAEHDRAEAVTERQRAGDDLTASQLLFANAGRHDREAQEAADRDWNTNDLEGVDSTDHNTRDEERKQSAEATDQARVERGSGELGYDSSERRERFAASLEGKADQKTINARILADGENAKHPREAVTSQSGTAAKPRRSSKNSVQQRDRGGLFR
jgi:colicin import membrane protein